jgi:hypothetical protein
MDIDERLERLAERHESISEYVELKGRADQERQEALNQYVEWLTLDIRQLGWKQKKSREA